MSTAPAEISTFAEPTTAQQSRSQTLWGVIKRKPLGIASAALIALLVLTAIFANVLAPYDPLSAQPEIRLARPSWEHLFGTDNIGRDVLSRVIHGSRISLWVGLLALAIVSVLTPSTTNAMLAIAVVIIPGNSRIVRGAVLSAKQNPYVEATHALGCRHLHIIASHILPNVTAPILILASIWLGNAMLIGASLSFLGLGTQPPTPLWGLMLSSTGRAFMEQAAWLAIFPGLAINLAVVGFNLFGDTLREAWDPKLRRTS
jgi:peptide/nickel transport system permease protein